MNTAKRLLACGMAAAMVAGLTACDDETPANSGSSNNSVARSSILPYISPPDMPVL